MKPYCVCKLIDDTVLDFDKRCNSIDYDHDKYCIFKEQDPDESYIALAVIPHDSILYILRVEEESV